MHTAFYVDDGLTIANSTEEAIKLQEQLQDLFSRGGFLLHKWNSNDQVVYNTYLKIPSQYIQFVINMQDSEQSGMQSGPLPSDCC